MTIQHTGAAPAADAEAGWTPARTTLLRLHHALGLSAAVSAKLIGDVSRNAVVSKRRRLGLVGRAVIALRLEPDPPSRSAGPRLRRWRPLAPPEPPSEPLPFMDHPTPADARPATLTERAVGQCAWPLGPAEQPGGWRTLFCGAPVLARGPYCPTHRARAGATASELTRSRSR